MQRDLIGYGQHPPVVHWPNGARIAVSIVVNYEEGSERSLLDGDDFHETNNEVPSPVPPGDRDLFNESFFEYGSRVGVWRLLDLFDRHNVKSTFYCCALALERNPEVARAIVFRGHEVCGHGYRWEEYHSAHEDYERESIRRTVESLERTTGVRPYRVVHPLRPQRQHPPARRRGGRVRLRQHRPQRRPSLLRRRQ